MMTERTTGDRYRSELEIALRMRGATGARIGEVLAEVEAHVAESGEDAVSAFGPAKEYARAVALPERSLGGRGLALRVLGGALSGVLLSIGVIGLLRDGSGFAGLPAWLFLAAAVAMFALFTALTPVNAVVDPRTGRRLGPGRRSFAIVMAVFTVVLVALLVVVGLVLR